MQLRVDQQTMTSHGTCLHMASKIHDKFELRRMSYCIFDCRCTHVLIISLISISYVIRV